MVANSRSIGRYRKSPRQGARNVVDERGSEEGLRLENRLLN
jgi:hypothetical protein